MIRIVFTVALAALVCFVVQVMFDRVALVSDALASANAKATCQAGYLEHANRASAVRAAVDCR